MRLHKSIQHYVNTHLCPHALTLDTQLPDRLPYWQWTSIRGSGYLLSSQHPLFSAGSLSLLPPQTAGSGRQTALEGDTQQEGGQVSQPSLVLVASFPGSSPAFIAQNAIKAGEEIKLVTSLTDTSTQLVKLLKADVCTTGLSISHQHTAVTSPPF